MCACICDVLFWFGSCVQRCVNLVCCVGVCCFMLFLLCFVYVVLIWFVLLCCCVVVFVLLVYVVLCWRVACCVLCC